MLPDHYHIPCPLLSASCDECGGHEVLEQQELLVVGGQGQGLCQSCIHSQGGERNNPVRILWL